MLLDHGAVFKFSEGIKRVGKVLQPKALDYAIFYLSAL